MSFSVCCHLASGWAQPMGSTRKTPEMWEGKRLRCPSPLTLAQLRYCGSSRKNIKLPTPFSTKRKAFNQKGEQIRLAPGNKRRPITAGERAEEKRTFPLKGRAGNSPGPRILSQCNYRSPTTWEEQETLPHTRCCAKHTSRGWFPRGGEAG